MSLCPYMTAAEFRDARVRLGLSVPQLARVMGVTERTVNRWQSQGPSSLATNVMQWFIDGYRPKSWPRRTTYKPRVRKSAIANSHLDALTSKVAGLL